MKFLWENLDKLKILILLFLLFAIPFNNANSQTIASKFDEAMGYYNQKNYGEALNKFKQIQSPDFAKDKLFSSAKYYMAECLTKMNQINGAIAIFEDFTKNYKFSSLRASALYNLGTLYYEKAEYRNRRKQLLILIRDYPNSKFVGSSYFFIGDSYLKQTMYYDAEENLGLAVSNATTNNYVPNCIYSLGSLYEFQYNYSKAISYYDELLTYHQSSKLAPLAQLRIGVAYFQLKDYDNAILELSNPLITALPRKEQTEALFLLANSYVRLKEFKSAKDIYNQILNEAKTERKRDDVKFGLAWIDFLVNNFEDAYKIFAELKSSTVDSIKIKSLYWSAESKRYAGDEKKAIQIYNKFLKKYGNTYFAQRVKFGLASIFYRQGNKKEAERILISAINSAAPNVRGKVLSMLGEISLERKDFKLSKNYFEKAVKIKNTDNKIKQHAQLGLAVTDYYLNKFNNAIKILNDIKGNKDIEVDKDKLHYYLAESYFAIGKFGKAVNSFNLVVTKNSDLKRQSLYGKAYSYFNNKDYINAVFYFGTYVSRYKNIGNYYNAKLRLADSYYGTKEFNKAVKMYGELFAKRANLRLSAFSYYQYGQALYKAGNSANAIKELTELQKKFPKSKYADDAQFVVAWIYFKQHNYDNAVAEYLQVLNKYPNTPLKPLIYYSIGDCYFNKGNYEKAISYYAKVIDDFPNSSYVYDAVSGIQYCYIAKDQPANAVKFIDQFVDSHPKSKYTDKIMLKKGELYFSNANYKLAEESYLELIQKYPKSNYVPEAHYWVGKSASMLHEDDAAESNFIKVISLSPKSEIGIAAVLELGKIYKSKKQYKQAIDLFSAEAEKIPKSPRVAELLFMKAQAQLDAEQISKAFGTFNGIVYYYENSIFGAKAKIEMGLIELARQSYENAELLFKGLGEKRTDDIGAKAQYYYGLTLFQQNKTDDAISAFVRVESLFSDYEEWYLKSVIKLGDCYVKLGDKKKAKSIYRAIYKTHKNDEYGREAKNKLKKL